MNRKEAVVKNELLSSTAMLSPSAQRFRLKSFPSSSSKFFSGIFANRVKNVKFFTSYGGEAVLLHQKIKEAISIIMNCNQDTRISLRKG